MKRVYIAAPLFNEIERARNSHMKHFVEGCGFHAHLPQDEAGVSYDLFKSAEEKLKIRQKLFNEDVAGIKHSDIILCLFDGRVPDEGTCIELGMAFAWGKLCIGFKTDKRAMDCNGDNNIMIDGCITPELMTTNLEELKKTLLRFK